MNAAGPRRSPKRVKNVVRPVTGTTLQVIPPFGGTISDTVRPMGSRRKE
jgi:hypothetical protein